MVQSTVKWPLLDSAMFETWGDPYMKRSWMQNKDSALTCGVNYEMSPFLAVKVTQ